MGRGDKKTKKGKRFASSYGRVRVKKEKTAKYFVKPKDKKKEVIEVVEKKDAPKKKTTAKKTAKKVTKKEK